MQRLGLLLAALACTLSLASAQHKRFTLEQVMSAPFPTELVAAPAGGAVAWVFNARGARNIWVAEPPDYRGRAITDYPDDDGQDVGELQWTPDGKAIVYTRGGDLENDKEYPNPRSFPQGVEQDVWVVSTSGASRSAWVRAIHRPSRPRAAASPLSSKTKSGPRCSTAQASPPSSLSMRAARRDRSAGHPTARNWPLSATASGTA